MTQRIFVRSLTSRVCIYGSSTTAYKIRGISDCVINGERFVSLDLHEGHLNTAKGPARSIVVNCSVTNWHFAFAIAAAIGSEVEFHGGRGKVAFMIERVSSALIARGDLPTRTNRLHGRAIIATQNDKFVYVKEPELLGGSCVNIDGSPDAISAIANGLLENNVCELVLEDNK